MPVYEFYCSNCNTIYNFFSRTVNTGKIPDCPSCKNIKLQRRMSLFAAVSNRKESGETDAAIPDLDEAKMKEAMAILANDAGKINEQDPRQAARLMKKLSEATGVSMGAGMEEALRRMEQGEDPEKIEEEMGDLLEKEEPFTMEDKGPRRHKKQHPKINETLYEL